MNGGNTFVRLLCNTFFVHFQELGVRSLEEVREEIIMMPQRLKSYKSEQ
jgi:hypothetical protein